jgi:arabinoxylan arabinofuranohydrolase
MQQVFNPYLPSWEYVPDGEPHIFEGRVYVYGSHDHFGAPIFCVGDYVCWSAPVDDLKQWRYEGVIYRKNQDPKNKLGIHLLFAPDVARGRDGRYYLYYAFDFMGMIGVAVSDKPAGPFEFYGHVHYADGTIWGRKKEDQFPFDPAVLVDTDGSVYLYSGFYTPTPAIASSCVKLKHDGGTVAKLEPDMLTIRESPKVIFPKQGKGAFDGHEFFEASSIRKDGEKYIFVYSSKHNHELCYAVSDYPDRDFTFGGTLVDLGDLFLNGITEEKNAINYLGNTHGGMLNIGQDWYIFYHRQTNQHSYSRQACAEKLEHPACGVFKQAEVTSCGLNGGPLAGTGEYEARIACNLWSREGTARYDRRFSKKTHPYFTQTGRDRTECGDQYIANMQDGSVAGFKYFDFRMETKLCLTVSGNGEGHFEISHVPSFSQLAGDVKITVHGKEMTFTEDFRPQYGVKPLYFRYRGTGSIHFHKFRIY